MRKFDSKILVNLSQDIKDKLEVIAEEQDMTVSQVVRRLINSHVRKYDEKKALAVSLEEA